MRFLLLDCIFGVIEFLPVRFEPEGTRALLRALTDRAVCLGLISKFISFSAMRSVSIKHVVSGDFKGKNSRRRV